jgi:hypothetical protein
LPPPFHLDSPGIPEKVRECQGFPGNPGESPGISENISLRALPPLQFSENPGEIFFESIFLPSFLCESQGIFPGDLFSFESSTQNSYSSLGLSEIFPASGNCRGLARGFLGESPVFAGYLREFFSLPV